jgi:hypothetical protein
MSDRYFFMVNDVPDDVLDDAPNDAPDEARPVLQVATTDARGRPVDIWHFFRGETYTGEPVPVINVPEDRQYQILFDVMLIPLVSRALADLLRDAAGEDVQLVPTTHPAYWILNVLRVHDAIDWDRSRFMAFPADEPRADLAGKPYMFTKVVLSPDTISASVFRLVDWSMAIVVSESVCRRVTDAALPGVFFSPIHVGDHPVT